MISDIIDKWKLNRTMLASKMGISKGYFNNKLSGNPLYKFSPEEMKKLKSILAELRSDLEKLK